MPYEPFHERFPRIAEKETRIFIVMNDPDLSDDTYMLIEAYCNEPNCDCRRVFFNVYSEKRKELMAVIAYGWESREFYRQWFGKDDEKIIDDLKGPALNLGSPQSELAPKLLEKIEWVLKDEAYVSRLKRHYRMFKETVDENERATQVRQERKVGRNDPCPCGSGRKYKHCCGKRR
jgi:hypothetical protein